MAEFVSCFFVFKYFQHKIQASSPLAHSEALARDPALKARLDEAGI